jgi:hypothetical protein
VDNQECLFVFVEHPEVEGTNNQSERDLRRESLTRKTSRTSKSQRGDERREIISVLGTIKRILQDFSLKKYYRLCQKFVPKTCSSF